MANGAEVNGVEGAQFVDGTLGQCLAGLEIAFATEVEVLRLVANPLDIGDRRKDFEGFGGDFGASSITPDNGDLERVVLIHNGYSQEFDVAQTRDFSSQATLSQAADEVEGTLDAVAEAVEALGGVVS